MSGPVMTLPELLAALHEVAMEVAGSLIGGDELSVAVRGAEQPGAEHVSAYGTIRRHNSILDRDVPIAEAITVSGPRRVALWVESGESGESGRFVDVETVGGLRHAVEAELRRQLDRHAVEAELRRQLDRHGAAS